MVIPVEGERQKMGFAMHLEWSCHRCERQQIGGDKSKGELGALTMMNPTQVIFRALPVSEFPEASRNSRSIDAGSAHMDSASG